MSAEIIESGEKKEEKEACERAKALLNKGFAICDIHGVNKNKVKHKQETEARGFRGGFLRNISEGTRITKETSETPPVEIEMDGETLVLRIQRETMEDFYTSQAYEAKMMATDEITVLGSGQEVLFSGKRSWFRGFGNQASNNVITGPNAKLSAFSEEDMEKYSGILDKIAEGLNTQSQHKK